jgi:chitin disaccharide deacetylase
VLTEISRQLTAFRRLTGREPTHLDSHQHVHRNEPVRSGLAANAQELRVPLRHFCPKVSYCGAFYGQDEDGTSRPEAIAANRLMEILSSLSAGTTELACHPGFADDLDTMYRDQRRMELSALCDPSVKQAIEAQGIRLCSFLDCADSSIDLTETIAE